MSHPEHPTRRVALVLGPGGASRYLLDCLQPLLGSDRGVELQGIYVEERAVRHAAAMPFVKELCRVTMVVREFDNEQMNRALVLRMRTARRALAVLADRSGVAHSFRSLRGSAIELLKQAAAEADITVFEPVRPPLIAAWADGGRRRPGPVTALLTDSESCDRILRVAGRLAGGDMQRVLCVTMPADTHQARGLEAQLAAVDAESALRLRHVAAGTAKDVALAVRKNSTKMLVAPATRDVMQASMLSFLREQMRCPVCLVRQWGE